MKVPVSWLSEYVPLPMPLADLAERLAVAAAEVERVTRRGVPDVEGNLGRFVVGKVVEAGRHPNADRLQLCRVDTGDPEPRQIVCGAWNFGAGATVAVATPGAILPDGRKLERAKLRGEVSDGMILAEDEVELGPDHGGIMLLDDALAAGTPVVDVLPIADHVLEIELTGNRPDLLSVYGLAREIAALYDLGLAPLPGADPPRVGDEPVPIEIDDPVGCPRYIGRLFRGCAIGPSPTWLRARLVASGMRPISNVVDVTNYVMLALGSPLHAFDHARLAGGRIGVRRARPGERIALDGNDRSSSRPTSLITDGERAVALAAIMGGLDSEVGDETVDVLLEAASFEPHGILASSERLGLRSEASNRWEKGVDPHLAGAAATLASELIVELAGGRFVGHGESCAELPARPVTTLRPARVDALVGTAIPPAEQAAILRRLGFEVDDARAPWRVTTPTWRARDVTREIDLVEEVARVHGLERVPFTLPARREMFGRLDQAQRLRRLVEDVLVGQGLYEAYTWTLVARDEDERALRLESPLTADHAILRTTLADGLVGAARHNVDAGNREIGLFEIARVYLPDADGGALPDERWHAGGIVEGGFSRAKGVVEAVLSALHVEASFPRASRPFLHPGKSAEVAVGAGAAGWVGELHPLRLDGGWGIFELDLATLFAGVPERRVYEDVVTFPAVRQDLAFVVAEEVAAGDLVASAREAAGPELAEIDVFDVYRGGQLEPGTKSVAFAVAFRSPERTLSDEDARVLRERIVAALAERHGATLRS
ncbi:MAG: phenylalanine--tRNA ligase subunit beta [Thermoleophilia bacterium]